jgi:hypothetical protein
MQTQSTKKTLFQLNLALLFTASFLLALFVLAVRGNTSFDRLAAAGPLLNVASIAGYLAALSFIVTGGGTLFDSLAAAGTLLIVASIAGNLAALSFIVTGGLIAVRVALQPGGWGRKLLYVLPLVCVGLLLVGVVLQVAGIGTLGGFTMGWLIVSALLSLVLVLIAVARVSLDAWSLKAAMTAVTGGLSLLTLLALIVGAGIFFISPPGAKGAAGQAGLSLVTRQLLIISLYLMIFGALAWVTIARAWRALRGMSGEPVAAASPPARIDYRRETSRALISCAGLAVVAGLAIQ